MASVESPPKPGSGEGSAGSSSVKHDQVAVHNIRGPFDGDIGVLRIVVQFLRWKSLRTQRMVQLEASTTESIDWYRISQREYGLTFKGLEGRFDFFGFREHDYEPLQVHFRKHWNISLNTDTKFGCKGWNWGTYEVSKNALCFNVDDRRVMSLPIKQLRSVASARTDIDVEISSPQLGENAGAGDFVSEIKFCVPPMGEGGDAIAAAENLKTLLMNAAGLAVVDSMICSFDYKQCSMPPGRFDIQFYPNSLKLHGKSSDFRVPFDNIVSCYMLPAPQASYSNWVLKLENPLKKGQTKYPAVIIQVEDKSESDIPINIPPELTDVFQKYVPEAVDKSEVQALENILAGQLIMALAGKPLLGQTSFKSATGHPCFRCSLKVENGFLYPLAKEFVYIPKPFVTFPHEEIASVNFGRTQGQQTRSFGFSLLTRSGQEYQFNVERAELQPIVDYVSEAGLKIVHSNPEAAEDREYREEDAAIDEDEDFEVDDDEDEE